MGSDGAVLATNSARSIFSAEGGRWLPVKNGALEEIAAASAVNVWGVRDGVAYRTGFGGSTRWIEAGVAQRALTITGHAGGLYMVSGGVLQRRGKMGRNSGSDWEQVGTAPGVTALASFRGGLFALAGDKLLLRGRLGRATGSDWTEVGTAPGVTALATHKGALCALQKGLLVRRGKLGKTSGADWARVAAAPGISAIAAHEGALYGVTSSTLMRFADSGGAWTQGIDLYRASGLASVGGRRRGGPRGKVAAR